MADRTALDDADFAAALAALKPRAASLDRDELFYRAGRESAASRSRARARMRQLTGAAGWLAATVFFGLWSSRPAVVPVAEESPVERSAESGSADSIAAARPEVEQTATDAALPLQTAPSPAPLPSLWGDGFARNRVSLVGTLPAHDDLPAEGGSADARDAPVTYAELMREYLPRSNEYRPATSPSLSVQHGDRI